MNFDPIELEVFKNIFISIAEEMGMVLGRTAFSPNIKERKDFSCALFDRKGETFAQGAHIPVHLGAMSLSVQSALKKVEMGPDDTVILNNPYEGGTHLPDITCISPLFINNKPLFFIANRAHHSDVGGITPGSMPLATSIFQEGIIIPPLKIISKGKINEEVLHLILTNVRTPEEREGDLKAQLAANEIGKERLKEVIEKYGLEKILKYTEHLKY
ncbi:hydantoinase B/oxoprolinase family protein, partial [Candidatus Aminicenantes bacterium AH-873-B07]|nr:hydantoinase B/oxoprolinase family protein [Candidatus Aminicenantes bacterium AH-873-B07]